MFISLNTMTVDFFSSRHPLIVFYRFCFAIAIGRLVLITCAIFLDQRPDLNGVMGLSNNHTSHQAIGRPFDRFPSTTNDKWISVSTNFIPFHTIENASLPIFTWSVQSHIHCEYPHFGWDHITGPMQHFRLYYRETRSFSLIVSQQSEP